MIQVDINKIHLIYKYNLKKRLFLTLQNNFIINIRHINLFKIFNNK